MTLAMLLTPPMSRTTSSARHFVKPEGIVSTGFPAVQGVCREIRLHFDPWQVELNRAILAKNALGLYAADTVVISIPRQVGKTWNVGALVFADAIINPGSTTVWTAHRFKVARETFNELRALALSPALAAHIDPDDIYTAAGNESITFRNGSRIVFAARERGAIRGFTKVRRLVLDEGQILTDAALSDLAPTMNQATNPQIIIMGTPPRPNDPGEVFTRLRTEALEGSSEGVLYVEYSAPPDLDLDDDAALRIANASYPSRTSRQALERLRKLLSDEDFGREVLGRWDEASHSRVISAQTWAALATSAPPAQDVPPTALAVDMSHDRAIAIAGCWRDEDAFYVELLAFDQAHDTLGAVEWLVERAGRRIPVVIDSMSPAASMIPALKLRKVKVIVGNAADMGKACGGIYDDATSGRLRHGDQDQLNSALAGAKKRAIGQAGGWGWDRKDPDVNISPLVAATLARFGASVTKKPGSGRQGGGRRAVMLS